MNENLLSHFAFIYCLYILLHVSLVHYIIDNMVWEGTRKINIISCYNVEIDFTTRWY